VCAQTTSRGPWQAQTRPIGKQNRKDFPSALPAPPSPPPPRSDPQSSHGGRVRQGAGPQAHHVGPQPARQGACGGRGRLERAVRAGAACAGSGAPLRPRAAPHARRGPPADAAPPHARPQVLESKTVVERPKLTVVESIVGDESASIIFSAKNEQGAGSGPARRRPGLGAAQAGAGRGAARLCRAAPVACPRGTAAGAAAALTPAPCPPALAQSSSSSRVRT
jgi:hypothetical protein